MNHYELSRKFWDFSFDNPDKIKSFHSAIYFFAIEHCNRLGWKTKFGFPSSMAMEATGIKSYKTYISAFLNLCDWGFITLIERSKNQYSSNIISLGKGQKNGSKSLDKALIKHKNKESASVLDTEANPKHIPKQVLKQVQNTYQSIVSIDKQRTNKQINNKQSFDNFRKNYPGRKRGLETEFKDFQKHKDYEEVLFQLLPALENQIEIRKKKKAAAVFVPEWKNLKTWINQRCWEEVEIVEIPLTENQKLLASLEIDEILEHGTN